MMLMIRHCRWWMVGAGLLSGLVVGAWFGSRWLARSDGNSEEVFSRIRVGMSQHEVVEVLRTYRASAGRSSSGATTDGRLFDTLHLNYPKYDDLPPPGEIEWCVMNAMDDYGREIDVTLGPGGTVTGKRLTPGMWEYRWKKAYRELRHKPYRALLYKYRYITFSLTAGILLASLWALRFRAARRARAGCRRRNRVRPNKAPQQTGTA